MELDSKGLARLRRVADPRDVWTGEATDFTPWLAENLDVLADELGMVLTLVGTEVQVGGSRLDIRAQDEQGRVVVVENQLAQTDHGHLGQSLVYAAGLEAAAVVWVAPAFREDHRRALDWLNERTDEAVDFFGVEVHVVQIGDDGPRAPVFEVVARPNGWQKGVKSEVRAEPGGAKNDARQEFFSAVAELVSQARPAVRKPAPGRGNWLSFASGPFGYWALSVIRDGRLRIEAYLDCADKARNEALLARFAAEAARWEQAAGTSLSFEELTDRRASRIATYHDPVDGLDQQARTAAVQRAARTLIGMYDALDAPLRRGAAEVKAAFG